jgi:hypothetical protein
VGERSDDYYVERLIGRIRLLIATSDEIPVETKLETQPMLKEFEANVRADADQRDPERARAQYAFLCDKLEEHANLQALLGALRNFIPEL